MKLSISCGIFVSSLILTSALPYSSNGVDDWTYFKVKYERTYGSEEEEILRMKIFEDNKIRVEEHNRLHAAGLKSYSLALNKFSDLTAREFEEQMTGFLRSLRTPQSEGSTLYDPPKSSDLPAEVDWRTKGAVTPVKYQGLTCGSCWAFSAIGSLEGQNFLTNGKLVSFSEQNLVDCDKNDYGCEGGDPDSAYDYIIKNKGIDTEDSYKYEGTERTCRFKKSSVGAQLSGYIDIPEGNETALQAAVANEGPISVAISATTNFRFYKDGVFWDDTCSSKLKYLNHAVTVVGYGTDNKKDYWLVKNSWGTDWGEDGYIRMARNKDNECGIATYALYPLVVKT